MMFGKLFIFLFFCGLSFSAAVYAQTPGSSTSPSLDPEGIPYSAQYWQSRPGKTVISLIRKKELTENQFVLRITDPFVVSGCAAISNYGYSAEYKDVYLDITLEGLTVDMRDQPQYAHIQCDRSSKAPIADIVINRSDLEANATRTIRLHNGTDTNYYNISLNQNRVMLLPDAGNGTLAARFAPQSIPGRKSALSYWFYPLGTLVLWTPGVSGMDEKGIENLRTFAQTLGLTPLQTLFPDFTSPLKDKRYQYFVDTGGRFDKDDPAIVDGKSIGNMRIEKRLFGLEKEEIKADVTPVYAKRPGMNE